jgi:hypothetical protein
MPNLLYASYCTGGAEPRSEGELRTQSQSEMSPTHEGVLPIILGKLSLGSERPCYHEKVCGYHCCSSLILIFLGWVVGACDEVHEDSTKRNE